MWVNLRFEFSSSGIASRQMVPQVRDLSVLGGLVLSGNCFLSSSRAFREISPQRRILYIGLIPVLRSDPFGIAPIRGVTQVRNLSVLNVRLCPGIASIRVADSFGRLALNRGSKVG